MNGVLVLVVGFLFCSVAEDQLEVEAAKEKERLRKIGLENAKKKKAGDPAGCACCLRSVFFLTCISFFIEEEKAAALAEEMEEEGMTKEELGETYTKPHHKQSRWRVISFIYNRICQHRNTANTFSNASNHQILVFKYSVI